MNHVFRIIKKIIPESLFQKLQPMYHYLLAFLGAVIYRSPSKEIYVLGVTGTKGKSSVTEINNTILEKAGYKTGMVNGIRFKIGKDSTRNRLKMTMPGRFTIQKYMRKAVNAGCDYFILEMTSEGAKQYRHKFIELNALTFTNLSPEHIESHGSYENYRAAKLRLARALETSEKTNRAIIANRDDQEADKFLAINVENKITYSLEDAKIYRTLPDGVELTYEGERMTSNLRGKMNISNLLAGISFARFIGVEKSVIRKAIENIIIPGRLEQVNAGQDFEVIADYAHTADSLKQLYQTFSGKRKIAVLGACGGGRDKEKRSAFGALADEYCESIVLTDEDPYDEDPDQIIRHITEGITQKEPIIIRDRREAFRKAFSLAEPGDAVLITGKGTDPYIMIADGGKIPWSDAQVAREELEKMLAERNDSGRKGMKKHT